MHCRRFDHSCCRFGCRRFGCRRFGVSPFCCRRSGLVAVMTCIQIVSTRLLYSVSATLRRLTVTVWHTEWQLTCSLKIFQQRQINTNVFNYCVICERPIRYSNRYCCKHDSALRKVGPSHCDWFNFGIVPWLIDWSKQDWRRPTRPRPMGGGSS